MGLYNWVLLPPAVTLFVAGSTSTVSKLDKSTVRPFGASHKLLCIEHSHLCTYIAERQGSSGQDGQCKGPRLSTWLAAEQGLRMARYALTTELPPPLTAREILSGCAKSTAAETSAVSANQDPLSSGDTKAACTACRREPGKRYESAPTGCSTNAGLTLASEAYPDTHSAAVASTKDPCEVWQLSTRPCTSLCRREAKSASLSSCTSA